MEHINFYLDFSVKVCDFIILNVLTLPDLDPATVLLSVFVRKFNMLLIPDYIKREK